MNIFYVIYSSFPAFSGGRERWISEVSSRFLTRGHSLTIISLLYIRKTKKPFFKLDNRIRHFKALTFRSFLHVDIPVLVELDMLLFSFLTFIYLSIRARAGGIIISMNPGFEMLGPLCARKLLRNVKVICSVRGLWAMEMSLRYKKLFSSFFKKILTIIERYSFKNADFIIANGFDTATYYAHETKPARFHVLPNGVDTIQFRPEISSSSGHPHATIMSVASLRDIKGIKSLIQAVSHLRRINKIPFKVKIVGGGSPKRYIQEAAFQGVTEYIEFLGERSDVPHLLQEADIVACLSGGGGISHSLLEAMATGRAIVAWDTYTYSQVITNGYNGLLAKKNDVKELACVMKTLLLDREFQFFLGQNARKEALKYDWKNVVNSLNETLVSVAYHSQRCE